jgi:hypothetical protein
VEATVVSEWCSGAPRRVDSRWHCGWRVSVLALHAAKGALAALCVRALGGDMGGCVHRPWQYIVD